MSAGAVLYYASAYSVASIAAFTVLGIVEKNSGAVTFDSFNGLAKKNKLAAFSMAIAMLSLAGIPPLAGFFGKYYLFASALQSGYVWLVLIAALGSLIGVYYYLKVVIAMYGKDKDEAEVKEEIQISALQKTALLLCVLLSLLMGFFPDLIIGLI
jgi:NADH-quinone oxidoreductase subunit N